MFESNNTFSTEAIKRFWYVFSKILDNVEDSDIADLDKNILTEIDLRRFELEKERQKFFDQRREFKKIVTLEARDEYLHDKIIEIASKLNEEKPLKYNKYISQTNDNECVIVLSDWHYGMVTDNIWQKFNSDICKSRIELFLAKTIERLYLHKPKKVHIVLLGDLCHGAIHTTARVASNENTSEQIMRVSELIAKFINEIANYTNETTIYSTYGNHLRTVQNKKDSIHSDNMEKLIPWWLKPRLKHRDDIYFCEDNYYEFLYLNVCGYNICATHGDLDRVKNAGQIINTIFTKQYGNTIDYVILADKHHLEEFETLGIETTIVGSLCGTDEHANNHRLYSHPRQSIFFFNECGRDAIYNIRLDTN